MITVRRRCLTITMVVALLLVGTSSRVAHTQSAARPNIVVIMIDDYDFASLGQMVVGGMLPNLARYFLQSGFLFSDAYSVAGLGGPSRATFLTGQYPHNHKVERGFPPSGVEVMDPTSTVATWVKAAGYRTAHVGRYVTGYGWWTPGTVIPPGWDEWNTLLDPGSNNLQEYKINVNGTVVDVGQIARQSGTELHQIDVLSVLARNFLVQSATSSDPFFLMVTPGAFNLATNPAYNVCPQAPFPYYDPLFAGHILGAAQKPAARHLDTIFGNSQQFPLLRGPSFNEADVTDKPLYVATIGAMRDEDIACLEKRHWRKLEVLRAIDDMIGMVMGTLEATGKLGNTVAVFTADNGWIDGQHRVAGKGLPYEEAIRVPLMIRTRSTAPLQIIPRMVLNTDLAPTIASLAEATPTHAVDGRSLVPLMDNPQIAVWRKMGLHEYVGGFDPFAERILPPSFSALRIDRSVRARLYAKYPAVFGLDGELYDLTTDPYQMQNLYTVTARRAERDWLDLWLNVMKTCKGTDCQLLENYFYFQ